MKNKNLFLLLVDKSTNAFGQILGITEEVRLKAVLNIIQSAIQDVFEIDIYLLTKKSLGEILEKGRLDLERTRLLANLLLTQAEVFLKLRQPQDSLIQYENALQIIQWQSQQPVEKKYLEKKNRISELETVIASLKSAKN